MCNLISSDQGRWFCSCCVVGDLFLLFAAVTENAFQLQIVSDENSIFHSVIPGILGFAFHAPLCFLETQTVTMLLLAQI